MTCNGKERNRFVERGDKGSGEVKVGHLSVYLMIT